MYMKKIINIIAILTCFNAFALDLQTKSRNSDKSLYESISNYKIMYPGYLQTSISYSLLSNPLVDEKTGNVLVDGLHEADFSMVYGFNRFFELGMSAPYIQTMVENSASNFNEYQGLSDLYIEGKVNVFDYFSLIPVYVLNLGNGLATTGTKNGGYGLKIVGGTDISKKLSLNYTLGQFFLEGTSFGSINQELRNQVGLGVAYKINSELMWGNELINDTSDGRKSTEILTHFTLDVNNFKTRMGVGSGFLNDNDENNLRVFFSLITDFNIFGKNKTAKIKPIKFDAIKDDERKEFFFDSGDIKDEIDKVDDIQEDSIIERSINSLDIDKNKLREELKKVKEKEQDFKKIEVEGHSVIPFYSVEEVKKETKEEINNNEKTEENIFLDKSELDIEDLRYLESRKEKIKETQRTLEYFVRLYKNKKISKERALKEFNWSKRVLRMRRDSIDDVAKMIKDKYGKVLDKNKITAYSEETIAEREAQEILDDEKKYFKKLVREARKDIVNDNKSSSLNTNKEEKKETEEERAARLTKEQEAVWKDGRTLLEMRQDLQKKLNKRKIKKKNVVKNKLKETNKEKVDVSKTEGIKKTSIEKKYELKKKASIVPAVKIGIIQNKKQIEKDLKNNINKLIDEENSKANKEINEKDYEDFYKEYKKKIEQYKALREQKKKEEFLKEQKEIKIENKKEEIKAIVKEEKPLEIKPVIKNKDAGELEVIELKNYKVKSIEERYEDMIQKESINKEKNRRNKEILNNFLEESTSPGLEEEGYIEKSTGPDY